MIYSTLPVSADQALQNDKNLQSSDLIFSENPEDNGYRFESGQPSDIQSYIRTQKRALPSVDISFIPNTGLTNPSVKFFVRDGDRTLFFTDERIIYIKQGKIEKTFEFDKFFKDMTGPATIDTDDRLPGTVNFFIGKKGTDWKRDIPTYGSIKYQNIYPGVHIRFDGNDGLLIPEISASAQADKKQVELALDGIDEVKKFLNPGKDNWFSDDSGNAINPSDFVSMEKLSHLNPATQKNLLDSSNNDIGLNSHANQTINLSHLLYSTYYGGSSNEGNAKLAVDTQGNMYISGTTDSIDLPVSPEAMQTGYGGGLYDVFVTKLNADGTQVLYTTYLGGEDEDVGSGIAIDVEGNAYLTGYTWSVTFPTTAGALQTNYAGNGSSAKNNGGDAFITKLNPSGNSLIYSTYIGGSLHDRGDAITIDKDGNAYITGISDSPNYPVSEGAYQPGHYGQGDVIISKLNSKGNTLLYSTYLGGGGAESGYSIALDSDDNAYVTGVVWPGQFPTTPGAFQISYGGGNNDAFVAKINPIGTDLIYSSYLGGNNPEAGYGITVDSTGSAYITGYTESPDYPTTPGAYMERNLGNRDVFITKIDPSGDSLIYSTFLGGNGDEIATSVTHDLSGSVYVTGQTSSTDFPITQNAYQRSKRGKADIFITVLDAAGSCVQYSSYFGGTGIDGAHGICFDLSGNLYVSGGSYSIDFPVTNGVVQMSNHGHSDSTISVFEKAPPTKNPDSYGVMVPADMDPTPESRFQHMASSQNETDFQINLSQSGSIIMQTLSTIPGLSEIWKL